MFPVNFAPAFICICPPSLVKSRVILFFHSELIFIFVSDMFLLLSSIAEILLDLESRDYCFLKL